MTVNAVDADGVIVSKNTKHCISPKLLGDQWEQHYLLL